MEVYKCFAESYFSAKNSHAILDQMCEQVAQFCRSVVDVGSDWLFDFGEGKAIVRPVSEGLLLWIAARDLIVFHGIRAILEGKFHMISRTSQTRVEWHPSSAAPFNTIQSLKSPSPPLLRPRQSVTKQSWP
jgi:hypothetical protein